MNKETRRLFKYLQTRTNYSWCGSRNILVMITSGSNCGIHITIDNTGGFEVRRVKNKDSFICDSADYSTESEKGLESVQKKKDIELVQSLFRYALNQAQEDYSADVDYIMA